MESSVGKSPSGEHRNFGGLCTFVTTCSSEPSLKCKLSSIPVASSKCPLFENTSWALKQVSILSPLSKHVGLAVAEVTGESLGKEMDVSMLVLFKRQKDV
ncbi:hypothetical protein GDO86_001300 [Hymenochirus boettgeri]|uniref:Uncharacterized protein n=1 Tax=Hymenochirus boettgeri TaxID=247094 RepID=A0A8T2KKW2_9PIPI|nr:hypothetical protein GDO86_001300 [Hymenochirus boettgeri]